MLRSLRARAAALIPGRHGPERERATWVRVGASYVYVGERGLLERRPAREVETARASEVGEALDAAEEGLAAGGAAAGEIERAERVLRLLAETPDPALAAKEADALVSYVAARAREGRSRDVLRAAHVLLGAFLLSVRLRELVEVLEVARDAGERIGDVAEQAWALHNLGTLAAAAGRAPAAAGLLEGARALFEQAGDHQGAAVSAHGLTPGSQAGTLGKATALVAAHKAAAVAVGVLVVAAAPGFVVAGGTWYGLGGGGGGSAEILGFGARTGEDGGGRFDEDRGWTRLPGSAVDPGGTIRVCDPLYIDSYVRLEGLRRGARWSLVAEAEDESFSTTYSETWRRRGAYTSGVQSFHGPPGGSSTGAPVPYGSWMMVVSIEGDERARASVTLVEDC